MLTPEERAHWIQTINNMTHKEMAHLYRFAPSGHPIFDKANSLFEVFEARFKNFGGFTPEISKEIGWK